MTPRFLERHQDYVLKIASLAPGQIMTAMPVVLDLDAPFVLRSRAFRVNPSQETTAQNCRRACIPENEFHGVRMRTTCLSSACQRPPFVLLWPAGESHPGLSATDLPGWGLIYVDVENARAARSRT